MGESARTTEVTLGISTRGDILQEIGSRKSERVKHEVTEFTQVDVR